MADPVLLVVDDNPVNLTMLARRLEREGYVVLKAQGGREAVETLQGEPVDLVLLDLFMPDMDGIEVLHWIRTQNKLSRVPVVMVSAATEIPQVVDAMRKGADDYVTKPIDFPTVLERIKGHLKGRQTLDPTNLVGQTIGPYQVEMMLGQGGMSCVYKCLDTRLNRALALKVLSTSLSRDPEHHSRFQREAQAVARLRHPAIVEIYDIGWDPFPYIAMERVQGQDLQRVLERNGPLKPEKALDITRQLLEALAVVHENQIVHRDLKPSNIMIESSGRVRLLDFGLAKLMDLETQVTRTGDIWGTVNYMAPEQVEASLGELGPTTDLFAVGTLLYRMLTDKEPARAPNMAGIVYQIVHTPPVPPDQLVSDLPAWLCQVCLKALEKNPKSRYPSAQAFLYALDQPLATQG